MRCCDMKRKRVIRNVFRRCFNCGYDSFDPELVIQHEGESYTVEGFIKCPKCKKKLYAWCGMRDRRKKRCV
jgi:hypothetical protein